MPIIVVGAIRILTLHDQIARARDDPDFWLRVAPVGFKTERHEDGTHEHCTEQDDPNEVLAAEHLAPEKKCDQRDERVRPAGERYPHSH